MFKTIELNIGGLHCRSCKSLSETEVAALAGIKHIDVDFPTGLCRIEFDDSKISRTDIEKTITGLNYTIIGDKSNAETRSKKIIHRLLLPLALAAAITVYLLFRAAGGFEILSRLNEESVSYPLILLIGFLASFHCIGMCGGLVTAFSAGMAAKNPGKKTGFSRLHLEYNLGRLVSYTAIGGILGGVGSFFGINPATSGAIMLLAGFFMVLMALSLFSGFRWLEKINFHPPQFIARWLYSQKQAERHAAGDTALYQTINMNLTYSGYSPNVLYIKPGIPVRWVIEVVQTTHCTEAIMIEPLGIKRKLAPGTNIIEFIPPEGAKEIKFSCEMRMVWGKFIVSDKGAGPSRNAQPAKASTAPTGTCSLD